MNIKAAIGASALALALLTSSLAQAHVSEDEYKKAMAITDADPWKGVPTAAAMLPPSPLMAELTGDTSDPLASIPPDTPLHPAAAAWTHQFLEQLLGYSIGVLQDDKSYELFLAPDYTRYAAYY